MDARSILSIPYFYQVLQRLVGPPKYKKYFVDKFLKPFQGCKILDIGCGPADILEFLVDYEVEYTGFDQSEKYIANARERYKNYSAQFFCNTVSEELLRKKSNVHNYDIVLASNVLHHLDDLEALNLLNLAKFSLKKGGRIITCDGCKVENDKLVSRMMLDFDRGKYVRFENQYLDLARKVFTHVDHEVNRQNTLKISGIIMVMHN